MLGTVVGDVVGSVYERQRRLPRETPLFIQGSRFTDDTLFSIAAADALLDGRPAPDSFRDWGQRYREVGASRRFSAWLADPAAGAYQGDTNGALMRVSPAITLATTLSAARESARRLTVVTHDHPDALGAVDAYAQALWAALNGASLADVLAHLALDESPLSLDELHHAGAFRMKALQTLADVRACLMESDSFEAVLRNAIYCGGDIDTLCAIAGELAAPLWGIPGEFVGRALRCLPADLREILERHDAQARRCHPAPRLAVNNVWVAPRQP